MLFFRVYFIFSFIGTCATAATTTSAAHAAASGVVLCILPFCAGKKSSTTYEFKIKKKTTKSIEVIGSHEFSANNFGYANQWCLWHCNGCLIDHTQIAIKVALPTGSDVHDAKEEEIADDDDEKKHVAIENSSTMRICQCH